MVQPSDFKPAWASVSNDLSPPHNPHPSHMIDDDDDETSDLQFSTSIDTTVNQDVSMKSSYDPSPHAASDTATEQEYGISSSQLPSSSSQIVQTPSMLSDSAHPFACIFHCLFKFSAMTLYIFGGIFTHGKHSGSHFIIITVFCILLLSVDFWVVKNITGRLLVGLRWWNKISDDGQSTRWIFESAEQANVNKFDNAVFWTVLYVTPVMWSTLLFVGFLKFEFGWLITVVMGLALSYANVYGYYRCSSEQKTKIQNMMAKGAEMGVMAAMKNNVFGLMSRMASSRGGSVEMGGRAGGAGTGSGPQFSVV